MSSIASASSAALDAGGILAGLAGATSMALGSTLSRKCQPPVSPLTSLSILQMAGIALVIGSILLSQRANKGAASGGQDPLTHSPVAEPQASVIK